MTYENITDEMIEQQQLRKKKFKKEAKEWIIMLSIMAVLLFGIIKPFIFTMYSVQGTSMQPTLMGEPTFMSGERVFVNKFSYKVLGRKPERGDVVIVDPINAANTTKEQKRNSWIKRVIAVEGDKIEVKDGRLYLNNEEVREEYVKFWTKAEHRNIPAQVIPEGHVYVMGDNRDTSHDSRRTGPIRTEDIEGCAEFIVWPFSKWGGL